jgi:dTDP-6-deoxy-L-talose 4-dehydrogenase (NAD+)
MKVAVTGATGFVGRHVLNALAGCTGVEVIASSRHPVAADALPGKVRHVVLDLAEPSPDDYDRLGRPDVLVHLAWSGLPNYRSLHHFETELPHQYRFLRSLLRAGLPSLLVAGTCYEYGMSSGELAETVEALPSNPYAHAKVALRQQLQFLRTARPFALTWARLFYMYGNGQPAGSLYTQLATAAARGDTSFAMSRGEQLRDFLPVEEVARCIVELALTRRDAGTVNICSGKPVSVRAFVERLMADNDWQIELDLGKYPYPSHEPLAFWGSTKKLRALIGCGDGEAQA